MNKRNEENKKWFRPYIDITIFNIRLNWFKEYEIWFIYIINTKKEHGIRFSNAGFLKW